MSARLPPTIPPGKQSKRVARQARSAAVQILGKREQNRLERLARVSEAARTLFRRKGFVATTTQEVAERAGIASGTLFLYADTKEDLLLLAFVGEILDVIRHLCASVPMHGSLADQALHLFEGMFAYHSEDIELARHLMRELAFVRNPQRRAEVGGMTELLFDELALMVRRAQQAGEVDAAIDPRTAGEDLFGLYFAPLPGFLNEFVSRDDYVRRLRRSMHRMVRGLAPVRAAAG